MLQVFFTLWVFILVVFHKYTKKIFSLPFLTFIIMFMGFYISYINPRKYYIDYNGTQIIIDGYKKIILDFLFHIVPFFFIYFKYGIEPVFNNIKIIPSILLIILYNLSYCPDKIYHLPKHEIAVVSLLSLVSYILISYYMN